MIQFIDRDQEIAFLEQKYSSNVAEMLIFYGRRRIGKTFLLTRFSENKSALYFLGRLESQEDTIKRLNQLFVEFFHDMNLLKIPINNWDVAWDFIGKNASDRLLFIIDEFPFIVERFPNIVSIIQDKWDNFLKNTKIMLILSGSSVAMMEKYAIDYKSPLYGRRTGQWKVDKIPVINLPEFFPKYTIEELLKTYASIDMIPGYLTKFNPEIPPDLNIQQRILSKGEYLYEEVNILLREEFRDPSNYVSILAAIAGGLTSFGEIANHTHLEKSLLSKYLATLELVNFIEKLHPILSSYKTKLKGKGLYRIKDNFIDFWFRFLFPYQSMLERGLKPAFLEEPQAFQQYLSFKFENFIIDFLPYLDIAEFSQIGKWWYKDIEIDICAVNEPLALLFLGECKWSNNVNTTDIASTLRQKSEAIQWNISHRNLIFGIFAKSFQKKINEFDGYKVISVDFEDLTRIISKKNLK